ncbi:MAG: two-component system sensor histidine kinase NtrB, partial [Spirochaetia bacterium]
MIDRISERWNITVSLLCYLVGAPLVAHFVSPIGLGGLLFAYPLYTITWLLGKKRGFVTAGAGVLSNTVIWFLAGSGKQVLFHSGTAYVAFLLLVECVGYAAFVLIISNMRRREDQSRDQIQRTTELLRLSEMKYRNLIEVAPEAISVVEKGKVIFFNSHLPEMFGYSYDEMQGMPLRSLLFHEDMEEAMSLYASRAEGKLAAKSVFRYVTKQGKVIWAETIGQRIEWEEQPAVLYFSSDITERKALEQQFAQAQKMEAIGQLTGGVAHDFNNIIQVITGYGEILMEKLTEENRLLLAEIMKAARKAGELTGQLLSFSRKQILRPRAIDPRSLIRSTQMMLERVIGEDVELRTIIDSTTGNFLADPGQMEQVLMNLAVNARDAMPCGGKLTIETSNRTFDIAYVRDHPGAKVGQYVRIAISDTGVGMNRETLSHIYEPFFTTKERGKGTGLGLSTVYGIVKQSEGYINCHSEVGRGTTFAVYLPLTRKESDRPPITISG